MADDAFHRRRDALLALGSPVERIRSGIHLFLELCTEDDFARIVLIDAPTVVPGQGELGSSYRLLREQLVEAVSTGAVAPCDPDLMAVALYGAAHRAGESVIAAADRPAAARDATRALDLLLDGIVGPGAS